MTADEVIKQYGIPEHILVEYHEWGLCGAVRVAMEDWQYSDTDLERLSDIMALHDMGFEPEEVEAYMRLALKGDTTKAQRLQMLNKNRSRVLDEIHYKEKQLEHMDYLRHEMRK